MLNRALHHENLGLEGFVKAFHALHKKERSAFFLELFRSKRLREELEDLIDIAIGKERLKEPSRPLEDVLRERRDLNRTVIVEQIGHRKDVYR